MYAPVPSSEGGRAHSRTAAFLACSFPCQLPAFDLTIERRNLMVSYVAGLLFSMAWWLLIDAHVISVVGLPPPTNTTSGSNGQDHGGSSSLPPSGGFSGAMLWWFYIPGIISTVALVMINLVTPEAFTGDASFMDDSSATKARIWMFVSFILAFSGLLGSGWILFALYVVPDRAGDSLPNNKWPGAALLLQNLLIFASAVVMRFLRRT